MSTRYDSTTVQPIYEVGWSYKGHPTPAEKRDALRLMLERYGDAVEVWDTAPEIRYAHIDQVQPSNWGRGPLMVADDCMWAVYGILKKQPEKGWVPEGVRLPMFEDLKDE